jgi:hypothetical protein
MQLVPRKYFLLFLAATLVVALGVMALTLSGRTQKKAVLTESDKEIQQIQTQTKGDDVDDIEKDLNETDLVDVDKELQDIENELNTTY